MADDLLVQIRASADQYAADLTKIKRESSTLANSLKGLGDPLKGFGEDAKRAGDMTSRAMMEARESVQLLSEGIGVHLPRSLTKFIADTKGLGPILAGAFSGLAVVGLISQLEQLPRLIDNMTEAITGWGEAAKKAYETVLEGNRKALDALNKYQVELLKATGAGLTGAAKEAVDQKALNLEIDQTKAKLAGLAAQAKPFGDELERQRKIADQILAAGEVPFRVGLNKQDAAELARLQGLMKDEAAALLELQRKQNVEAVKLVSIEGAESVKALEEHKKALLELITLNSNYLKFWEDQLQKIRTEGMISGGADIKAGIDAAKKSADNILQTYKEIRQAQLELINMNKAYLEFWEKELQKIRTGGMSSGQDDIKAGIDANKQIADDMIRRAQEVRDAGNRIIDDIGNSLTRMLENAISSGRTFWEAFKDLGQAAMVSVFGVGLKSLLHGLLDDFRDKFAKWQKDFEAFISKNKTSIALGVGGAAVGGAVAGKSGAVAGAAAGVAVGELLKGDWVGAAIAGIVSVGAAFTTMINQLHQQATKFVNSFQNPFTQAVGNIFDSLTEAKDMGTLTVDQVKQARIQFEKLWTAFEAQAKAAGVVGQQALATMTPFIAEWKSWLDGLDLAAASLEHMKKVMDFMSKVTDAAKDSEALNEAISNLQDSGASASSIIEFLGGDIESMVAAMKALNMELPAGISGIKDLMDAIQRIGEIDTELQSISEQLSSAIIRKLDFLDSAIQEASKNIEDWTAELNDLTSKLDDASYWAKQYDDAIRESAANYEKLTNERASIEKRIQTLTQDIERDKLVKALANAKATGAITDTLVKTFTGITKGGHAFTAVATSIKSLGSNTSGVAAAQKALDDFDAAIREQEMEARKNELKELQERLPLVISQQKEAETAYALASVAAQESIDKQKLETKARIDWLKEAIDATKAHLIELQKDKDATEELAKALGIARKSEFDDINDTIIALETRATKLGEERDQLKLLFPALNDVTDAIKNMLSVLNTPAMPASTDAGFAQVAPGGFLNYGLPSFDVGGVASRRGMAQVDAGELMIPKGQVGMIVRLLQELVKKDTNIVMDNTKLNRVQNRATQYGGTRSLASEVRR